MLFAHQGRSLWTLTAFSLGALLLAVLVGCRSGVEKAVALGCTLLGTCWLAFSVSPGSHDMPDGAGLRARLVWAFSPTRAAPMVFAPALFYVGLGLLAVGALIGAW
jgi:hypothetical protein